MQLFTGTFGSASGDRVLAREVPLVRLIWHKSYLCGEPSIDMQHHELFDLANELISAAFPGTGKPEQLPLALENLVVSLVRHFANEEALLDKYDFADRSDHVLKHQNLLGRAVELRSMAAVGELRLGDLVSFLATGRGGQTYAQ